MAGLLPFVFPLDHHIPTFCIELGHDLPPSIEQQSRPSQISKPKAAKRQSRELLTGRTLPETSADWRHVLRSVKREFQAGRYRQCLERCTEILDHVRELTYFQVAYLIYLHFYSACSLEAQVRNLHHSSAYRLKLLRQARDHFARASALVKIEDDDISRRSRSSSAASLESESPVDSEASWSSHPSERVMSPTPSLTFSDCEGRSPVKRRKRVRFSETVTVEPIFVEPVIRPDSPTLGFVDDWEVDLPPVSVSSSPVKAMKPALSMSTAIFAYTPEHVEYEDPSAEDRSLHRYTAALDSLRRQLPTHLASVDAEVMAHKAPRTQASGNEELRSLELQTRIQRLKANGWQRRRFDASRYEALRENVMADMMI